MKKLNLASGALLLAVLLLLLIVACVRAAPAAPQPAGTVRATPTPVPAQTRELAIVFVREYQGISQEWDRLDADVDQWRLGLTACDRAAGQSSLDAFAARANDITERARKLPRPPVLRDLADQLVRAAEAEELSLRQLRDGWQPANPGGYEAVEGERSTVDLLRRQVQDGLNDLQVQVDPSVTAKMQEFATALLTANATWDRVHQSLDSSRTLTGAEMADRLNQVIVGFDEVVTGIRALPQTPATSQLIAKLAEAAAAEDQALRKLRDPAAKDDPKAMAAADVQVLNSNNVRRAVQQLVVNIVNTPEDNQRAVTDFRAKHDSLAQDWDRLHQDYDRWRHGEAGCDGKKAIQALDQFVLQSVSLASRAQALPSAPVFRALREPLFEATDRQAGAFKALRASWRPYVAEVYKTVDQERSISGGLRRQVADGIQDLRARLSISAQDLQAATPSR